MSENIIDNPDEILSNADDQSKTVLENYWHSRDELIVPMRPKWREWHNLYRGIIDMQDNSVSSQLHVPMTFSHVESYLPRLVANRPRIDVWGRNLSSANPNDPQAQNDKDTAEMHRMLIHYDWDKLKMAWFIINYVKSAEIYGTAILKTFWKKKEQFRMVREPGLVIPSVGLDDQVPPELGERFQMKKRKTVVWDDVAIELLDLDEVFPDPRGWDEESCEFMTHRGEVQFHELENAMKDGKKLYNEDRLREIKKLMDDSNPRMFNERETLREGRQKNFGPDKVPRNSMHQQVVHVLEEWQDGKVTTIIEEFPQVKPIRSELHELGTKPFVRLTPIPSPGDFYGISIPEVLFSLNLELDTLHNARLDTVLQNTYNMFTVLDGTINPQNLVWRGRGVVPVEDHDDIRPLDTPRLDFAAYRESEALRVWGQLATGATDPFQGMQQSGGGTATEAQLLNQAGNSRAGLMFQILDVQALNRLGRLWILLNEAHITEERIIELTGREFEGKPPARIDPEKLISGNLDLDVRISTAETEPQSRQFKMQRAINAIQVLGQVFQDPNHPVIKAISEELMISFGFENPRAMLEAYVPPPPQPGQGGGGTQSPNPGQDLARDAIAVAPGVGR